MGQSDKHGPKGEKSWTSVTRLWFVPYRSLPPGGGFHNYHAKMSLIQIHGNTLSGRVGTEIKAD